MVKVRDAKIQDSFISHDRSIQSKDSLVLMHMEITYRHRARNRSQGHRSQYSHFQK